MKLSNKKIRCSCNQDSGIAKSSFIQGAFFCYADIFSSQSPKIASLKKQLMVWQEERETIASFQLSNGGIYEGPVEELMAHGRGLLCYANGRILRVLFFFFFEAVEKTPVVGTRQQIRWRVRFRPRTRVWSFFVEGGHTLFLVFFAS